MKSMKSLLILPFLLLGFSALQAQDTIMVNGTMANTSGTAVTIDVTLTAGRTPMTETVTTDSRGYFVTYFIVNTFIRQGSVDVEFTDCKRNAVKKSDVWGVGRGPVFNLDYCPGGSGGGGGNPTNCSAFFAVRQAYTGRNNPVPHSVIIYERSKGNLLTYSWDFGDGNSSNNKTPIHTYTGNGPYILCLAIADTNGCKDTLCDTVRIDTSGMLLKKEGFSITVIHGDVPTNIEAPVQDLSASIYPNPVSGLANIKLTIAEEAMVNTRVYDVSGMLVVDETSFAQRGENNLSLNMQSLKPGAYIVKISTTEGQWVESVIKN